MKKVIVFDLDDTLYTETAYVKSGFRAVADFLSNQLKKPQEELFSLMIQDLQNGRGSIFDNLLDKYNIRSKNLIRKCLSVYRLHKPNIKLDDDAVRCLHRFAKDPKYLVTDGNKIVQHNKIVALGLEKIMKHTFITHRYGVLNAKPSTYCFLKICKREAVREESVVYIGDNPTKDFIRLKPLGFKTIRILKGPFKDRKFDETHDAHRTIANLDTVTEEYLGQLLAS